MRKEGNLFAAARDAIRDAKTVLSHLEAIVAELEEDGKEVVSYLDGEVRSLEERIAAECKHSEKAWEEAWKWKEKAKYFAGILYDNGICPPSVDKMLRGDGDA